MDKEEKAKEKKEFSEPEVDSWDAFCTEACDYMHKIYTKDKVFSYYDYIQDNQPEKDEELP